MINRRRFSALFAGLSLLSGRSFAQNAFPDRPLRLIVPYGAGTAVDIFTRQLSTAAQRMLGQPFVVDNRPGAGGMLGAEVVAKSAPDGYTLVMGTSQTHAISPYLYAKPLYDPVRDFTPIAGLAGLPHVLVVSPQLQVNTVADFVALAKSNPGKYTFASTGSGVPAHLAGEIFKREAGIEINHVPYGGGSQAITDVLAGHTSIIFYPYQGVKSFVDSGKLRAIGTAHPTRPNWLRSVPTMPEQGYPKTVMTGTFQLYGPANMAVDRAERISQAFRQALATPEIEASFSAAGTEIQWQSPAELKVFTVSEAARYKALIALSGAKVE